MYRRSDLLMGRGDGACCCRGRRRRTLCLHWWEWEWITRLRSMVTTCREKWGSSRERRWWEEIWKWADIYTRRIFRRLWGRSLGWEGRTGLGLRAPDLGYPPLGRFRTREPRERG